MRLIELCKILSSRENVIIYSDSYVDNEKERLEGHIIFFEDKVGEIPHEFYSLGVLEIGTELLKNIAKKREIPTMFIHVRENDFRKIVVGDREVV